MFIRIKHVIGFTANSYNIREGFRHVDYDTKTYRDPEKDRLYIHNTSNSSTSRLINEVKRLVDNDYNPIISKCIAHPREIGEMIFIEKGECYHIVDIGESTTILHNSSDYYITVEGNVNMTRYLNMALKVLMFKLKTFKLISLKDKLSKRCDKAIEEILSNNPHNYESIIEDTIAYKRYDRIEKAFQKHVSEIFSRILTLYNEVSTNKVHRLMITTMSALDKPIGDLKIGLVHPYTGEDFEYVNIRQTYLDSLIDQQQAKAKENNEPNNKSKGRKRRTKKSI